ncbi:MAG: GAF domain-containing protein [Anaerolineae bacterium]
MRTKIIAWSFVPTAIILFTVALVTFYAYQQETENLVIERDQQLIRLSAGQLATEFAEYTDILTALARTADIYKSDPPFQRTALKRASNRVVIFDGGVLILNNFGMVVASEPERTEIIGQDWSNRNYFRQMVRSPGPEFSEIVADGPQGAEVIVVAVPITGELGEFRGTMAGMFRLGTTAVSTFYGDIVKQHIGEAGNTFLVDGNGRVIYHSDTDRIGDNFSAQTVVQQVLSRQVGAVRTRDFEGRDIVAGFAPVPGTSWGLITEESWAALTSGSRGYRRFLILLLALGVLAPALVVAVGIRRITQPITELIGAAQEVARGNFGQTITAQTGDEIEELAEQFNLMSAQLQESYTHLERRVANRTKELATLNAIAAVVSRSLDLEEVLCDSLDKVLEVLEFESGVIYLKNLRTGELQMACQRGLSEAFRRAVAKGIISARVAETGNPIIIDDLRKDSDAPKQVIGEGYRSLASIPLVSKGQVQGVLTAASRQLLPFHQQDVDLLLSIGHQIGVSVENARLFKAEQRRAEQFRVINEVGHRITSILAVDELLEQITHLIQGSLEYYLVGIALIEGDELVFKAGAGGVWGNPDFRPPRLKVGREGITGWVAQTGKPLLVPDVSQEPRYLGLREASEVRSELAMPLRTQEVTIGVLHAQSRRLNAFDESDVMVLQSLAHQAAVAIENARLFAERERRVDEMAVLNEVGQAISSTLRLGELLDLIHHQMGRVIDATNLYIALYDKDEDWLSFPLYVDGDRVRRDAGGRKAGPGLTEYVIRHRQPLLMPDDVEGRLQELGIESIGTPARSWLGLPMIAGDEVLGVIAVQSYTTEGVYDEGHLNLLSTIAAQAAIAIENARLYEQAQQLAEENARLFDLIQERRIHEQAALLDMSNQLLSRLDLDDLMGYLVKEVRTLLQADACAMLLPGEDPDYLAIRAFSGWRHDPVAEQRWVPADERSGPGLVMRTQQPLHVEDIEESDVAPWTSDWLETEGFRGHAVVPLIAEGRSIGALVLDTRRPRLLDEDEVRFLRLMANQAAIAIEKARLHQEEVKQERLEQELRVAQFIQQTLLPKEVPALPGWQVAAYYQPARAVGGDLYDFLHLPDGRLGFIIGDVAGKGVPAALVMATTRAVLRAAGLRLASPGQVLERVNDVLCPDMPPNMFVTCLYAVLDSDSGRLQYASAGQNPPYRRNDGGVAELQAAGLPLGLVSGMRYEENETTLAPGESILFSSDGLVEAHNPEREIFGFPRLGALMADHPGGTALIDFLLAELAAFAGTDWEQEDDVTLVTLQRSAADELA